MLPENARALLCCLQCSTDLFVCEVHVDGNPGVRLDVNTLDLQLAHVAAEAARPPMVLVDGAAEVDFSSPLWVQCPQCSAYRGDPCSNPPPDGYHDRRVVENVVRLMELPTYGHAIKTECCQREVWLIWRTTKQKVYWHGVPCPGCDLTYSFEMFVEEIDGYAKVDRLNPHMVEMCCWAVK